MEAIEPPVDVPLDIRQSDNRPFLNIPCTMPAARATRPAARVGPEFFALRR